MFKCWRAHNPKNRIERHVLNGVEINGVPATVTFPVETTYCARCGERLSVGWVVVPPVNATEGSAS